MSVLPYWIEPANLTGSLNSINSQHVFSSVSTASNAPILFFSSDDAQTLQRRLEDGEFQDKTALINLLKASSNKAPSGLRQTPESLSVSENGLLQMVWAEDNDHVFYPVVDGNAAAGREAPLQSFCVLITTWLQDFKYSGAYTIFKGHLELWVVGSVGAYQSGADLEFEGLEQWKLGRTLYVADTTMPLPIRLLK